MMFPFRARTTVACWFVAALTSCARTDAPVPAEPTASVLTALATEGALSATAISYGTVTSAPRHTVVIAVLHDGIVRRVHVRNGEVVRADQALVTLATAPAAAVQFAQTKSALEFAKQDLARIERLFADRLATNDQVAIARRALSDAQAQYDQQHMIGTDQAEEILRAPFDGVISGLSVVAGDRLQANTTIGTLASRSDLMAQLDIEPRDAAMMAPGMAVKLASPDRTVAIVGKLVSVGAMVNPTTRLVNALAEIPAADSARMVLGMTVVGEIDLPARNGVVISRDALLEDAQGTYIFTVVNGKAHRQPVQTLIETDDKALIASGVAAGTRVIIGGNAALEEGVTVQEAKP